MNLSASNTKTIDRPPIIPRWVKYIGLLYGAGVVALALLRLLFLFSYRDRLNDAELLDLLQAFAVGWRFDQIVVLLVLTPLLIYLPLVSGNGKAWRLPAVVYVAGVFSIVFLLLLADIRFFDYFDSHLNYLSFEYLGEGSLAFDLILSDAYFWKFILLWLLSSFVFAVVCVAGYRRWLVQETNRSKLSPIVWTVALLILSFIGIRGRLNLSPIDWGAAYFSSNHFVNQLALNGVYTLGRTLLEKNNDSRLSYMRPGDRFEFDSTRQSMEKVRRLLETENEHWLEPGISVRRVSGNDNSERDFDANIVIVVMESWSGRNTGALGSDKGLTPSFDSLAASGILFTDFYASGMRSSYGLTAILCSFPSLPGRAITNRYDAGHPFVSLPTILRERNYYNLFIYGGDPLFDNLEGFFLTQGYDRFLSESDFPANQHFSKWGVPDHLTFKRAVEETDNLPRPFNMTIFTLSNHEPFDLPDSSVQRFSDDSDSSRIFNCQLYADAALGEFIDSFRHKDVFDSTIFIFTADHTLIQGSYFAIDPTNFRIPLLIYSPALLGDTGIVVDRVGSQVDILPTLMHLLGGKFTHASWGRSLLFETEGIENFAMVNTAERIGLITEKFLYYHWLGRGEHLYDRARLSPENNLIDSLTTTVDSLRQIMRAFAQSAEQLSTPRTTGKLGR